MRTHVARVALIATLVWLGHPSPVGAAIEPPRLGLTPVGQSGAYFKVTTTAGATQRLSVVVANLGGAEVHARTYAADVYSLVNGGFGAALFGAAETGARTWIDYQTRELRLKPGDGQTFDFHVKVPDGTPPGQYVTGLVAENVEPYQGGAGAVSINQVNRVAIAVAIDIPGPRHPALAIGGVSYKVAAGTSFISFGVSNPGNVHLKPAGDLTLRDSAQRQVVQMGVTMDSVYAGTDTRLEVPVTPPLAPGAYCAELTLADASTKASASASCQAFTVAASDVVAQGGPLFQPPPAIQGAIDGAAGRPEIIALIALILILFFVLLFLLFSRRRRRKDVEEHSEIEALG